MAGAGADQIEVQGFDEAFADFEGSGGRVVGSGYGVGHERTA